jgi:biotin synthase
MNADRDIRYDWSREELASLYAEPFADLIFAAQTAHRRHFSANRVHISKLLSIKTGGCPEDCGYCPQSAAHEAEVKAGKLKDKDAVLAAAAAAKAEGVARFCLGAAWRAPKEKDLDLVCEMVREVRAMGLTACATLGMLTAAQAAKLKAAGLDYYNHNIDTSPEYYGSIVTTRSYQDRLDTLAALRDAGIRVCCGGIVGMGESEADRIAMIHTLATLPKHPDNVPINMLMRVKGTKLADAPPLSPIDLVRTIALARIAMPASIVALAAGREHMSDETQALCFLAGVNAIFSGDKLLTTANPALEHDRQLMARLGLTAASLSGE